MSFYNENVLVEIFGNEFSNRFFEYANPETREVQSYLIKDTECKNENSTLKNEVEDQENRDPNIQNAEGKSKVYKIFFYIFVFTKEFLYL